MMVVVNLSIKSSVSCSFTFVSINDVNVNDDVKTLRNKLGENEKIDTKNLNFIHHGRVLKDEAILRDAGINSGSMIYCFPKYEINIPNAAPLTLIEVQQLLISIRNAISSPNFRNFIEKLRTSEQIARLVSECPTLKKDPASLAYIQDPDLVYSLQNVYNLTKVVDECPVIGRVLQIVCNLITSEISSPRRSHHVSYSMDALSDEEMEIDQNEDYRSEIRSGSSSFQPITPAQLAAALANAAGSGGQSVLGPASSSAPRSGLTTPSSTSTPFNTPAPPSGSGAGGGASPGGSLITNEMFSQALQNALAASASSSSGILSGTSPTVTAQLPLENIEESLQLMREMGIPDEEMSIQALQATNGDVQAAVNLIFAQWMADD